MQTTNTIIIGAGQAGLAVSRCLSDLGRDHLVLERGRVAERWRSERWDSLRLLTPNWMTRLPGFAYDGREPDGFMRAAEVAAFFDRYAASFDAPVRDGVTVLRVHQDDQHFVVTTDVGFFRADNVVIATGWCDRPLVPEWASHLHPSVHQLVPSAYRNPNELPDGGVLVVGAAASGVQLADEFAAAGREVTLAVGSHARAPRRYRGMDIFWWLHLMKAFDRTVDDDVADIDAARTEPSLQVVGRPDQRTLDLASLQRDGVRLAGRVAGIDGTAVSFARDLPVTVGNADRAMASLLDRIDRAIADLGLDREVSEPAPIRRVITAPAPDAIDLAAEGIRTVVWATGFRRSYHWLDLPVLDARGEIRQYRGVTDVPGAYVLGLRFQHHRDSNFIGGVGRDAQHVAELIERTPRPLRRPPAARLTKRART